MKMRLHVSSTRRGPRFVNLPTCDCGRPMPSEDRPPGRMVNGLTACPNPGGYRCRLYREYRA